MDKWTQLFLVWVVALLATAGSLFFSEVLLLPPCVLCWYQRIAMYPLVVLLGMALFPLDLKILRYVRVLSICGWLISIYHNLLYYKILPESIAPCTQGISCTTVQWEWLGFVTIPFLSFLSFSIVSMGLLLIRKSDEV